MRLSLFALLVVALLAAAGAALAEAAMRADRPALVDEARAAVPTACPVPRALAGSFRAAARESRLSVTLLLAVGLVESNLRQDAVSSAGARGVMQVLPATAAELGLDAGRAGSNIRAGARYLRRLLDRFGSLDLALAAYNAGPTAVAAEGAVPAGGPRDYVAEVTRRRGLLGWCAT
jgi:soluble lytic murein transglycosylase-like protein